MVRFTLDNHAGLLVKALSEQKGRRRSPSFCYNIFCGICESTVYKIPELVLTAFGPKLRETVDRARVRHMAKAADSSRLVKELLEEPITLYLPNIKATTMELLVSMFINGFVDVPEMEMGFFSCKLTAYEIKATRAETSPRNNIIEAHSSPEMANLPSTIFRAILPKAKSAAPVPIRTMPKITTMPKIMNMPNIMTSPNSLLAVRPPPTLSVGYVSIKRDSDEDVVTNESSSEQLTTRVRRDTDDNSEDSYVSSMGEITWDPISNFEDRSVSFPQIIRSDREIKVIENGNKSGEKRNRNVLEHEDHQLDTIDRITCPICMKTFSSHSNRNKHFKKLCVAKSTIMTHNAVTSGSISSNYLALATVPNLFNYSNQSNY